MHTKVTISGTGRALPAKQLNSTDLDAKCNLASGTLAEQTGVKTRYICTHETQIDLAVTACRAALDDAGISTQDIDLVIGASAVPYQTIPTTAPLVMRALGIPDGGAAAFDVNSTCLSFLNGLVTAQNLIENGQSARALVFSSEIASRALPWDTAPEVAALFGDGAAAAVLGAAPSDQLGLGAFRMRTFPAAYEASELGAGGTRVDFHADPDAFAAHSRFHMDGAQLFRITARHFGAFVQELLTANTWCLDDIDLVIPHQASPSGLEHMIRHTGFPPERVINICADVGNQIAASIPFALDVARHDGRIPEGSKVLMLGTSAGVSFGGLGFVA